MINEKILKSFINLTVRFMITALWGIEAIVRKDDDHSDWLKEIKRFHSDLNCFHSLYREERSKK